MCSSYIKLSFLGLVLAVAACGDDGEYEFGFNTTGIEFELFDPTEGVHPSKVTLSNPRNPFRQSGVSDDTKFAIIGDGGNAGAFYAWATILAEIPIGENQFFTAIKLRDLYLSNEVAEEDRDTVRQMAIDGFQVVLDCFPESLLFDASGTFGQSLATLSFGQILDLGGVVQGDWRVVEDSLGNPTAVRSTGLQGQDRDFACR
ncbi:MAG: hypothetical protein HKP36_11005 [Myxococcales bacterium]|nr:hypothetical protein [Deltaproteobacteria bacterium]MBT8482105.1 hypothetical protein [Deltaproteobacteria bacterium]NNL24966.1 hypothetical protein [Myxococcales bacterium]RZV50303.1 MAG: hypothetical protein EX268_17320 [Deltaproteobacteria bacterium]